MDKLNDIQDYQQHLAETHVDLLHNTDGRKAFARFQTDEHITQIKKQATKNIVVILEVNGERLDDIDFKKIRRGISIIFGSRAATNGSAASSIDQAVEKSEEIMFDFINKMHEDQAQGCDMNFDLDRITWDNLEGPWLDNYYGWILFVPFVGHIPPHNPDKWIS